MTTISTSLSQLHVLVIDDDSFMIELLAKMLGTLGVGRVSSAGDGERGLACLGGLRAPDVVICDLHMPGKDGFEVMEAISAAGYGGGVILLSGMSSRVLNSAALMGKFHHLNLLGVLQKPASKQALADALHKFAG